MKTIFGEEIIKPLKIAFRVVCSSGEQWQEARDGSAHTDPWHTWPSVPCPRLLLKKILFYFLLLKCQKYKWFIQTRDQTKYGKSSSNLFQSIKSQNIALCPVRLNLSAVSFQRNNSVFLSQQISISISRFPSQPNRPLDSKSSIP